MLSKRYKSTDVDCRTWLHVPSETPWSTSSDTHQVVEILRCIHHFKSELINSMDHIRILVLNPRQWSLATQSSWKWLKMNAQKCLNTS